MVSMNRGFFYEEGTEGYPSPVRNSSGPSHIATEIFSLKNRIPLTVLVIFRKGRLSEKEDKKTGHPMGTYENKLSPTTTP